MAEYIKVCPVCQGSFKARKCTTTYCSRLCRMRAWRGISPEDYSRVCAGCGKEFEAKSIDTKYCSASCYGKLAHLARWEAVKEVENNRRKERYRIHAEEERAKKREY